MAAGHRSSDLDPLPLIPYALRAVCRTALRVFEVPLLVVALVALGYDEESAAMEANTKVVTLLVGQPLFFTWHPDSQHIVTVRLLVALHPTPYTSHP